MPRSYLHPGKAALIGFLAGALLFVGLEIYRLLADEFQQNPREEIFVFVSVVSFSVFVAVGASIWRNQNIARSISRRRSLPKRKFADR